MNFEAMLNLVEAAKVVHNAGCPFDKTHLLVTEWSEHATHITIFCQQCNQTIVNIWPADRVTADPGKDGGMVQGGYVINTGMLNWMHERYTNMCFGNKEPDIVLMGIRAHESYCALVSGRKDEKVVRERFCNAKVVRSLSIGQWEMVFGFKSTLQ